MKRLLAIALLAVAVAGCEDDSETNVYEAPDNVTTNVAEPPQGDYSVIVTGEHNDVTFDLSGGDSNEAERTTERWHVEVGGKSNNVHVIGIEEP